MPPSKGANAPIVSEEWEEILPFTQPRDLEIGESFQAFYLGANEVEVPDPNSEDENGTRLNLLHEFSEEPNSEPFGVWGSAGFDKRMAEVPAQTFVKVEYQGMVDLKGGRTARQYRVWVDRNRPF